MLALIMSYYKKIIPILNNYILILIKLIKTSLFFICFSDSFIRVVQSIS